MTSWVNTCRAMACRGVAVNRDRQFEPRWYTQHLVVQPEVCRIVLVVMIAASAELEDMRAHRHEDQQRELRSVRTHEDRRLARNLHLISK